MSASCLPLGRQQRASPPFLWVSDKPHALPSVTNAWHRAAENDHHWCIDLELQHRSCMSVPTRYKVCIPGIGWRSWQVWGRIVAFTRLHEEMFTCQNVCHVKGKSGHGRILNDSGRLWGEREDERRNISHGAHSCLQPGSRTCSVDIIKSCREKPALWSDMEGACEIHLVLRGKKHRIC